MKKLFIATLFLSSVSSFAGGPWSYIVLSCVSQQLGKSTSYASITFEKEIFNEKEKTKTFVSQGGNIERNSAISRLLDQSQVAYNIDELSKIQLSESIFVAQVNLKSIANDALIVPSIREITTWMICNTYPKRQ